MGTCLSKKKESSTSSPDAGTKSVSSSSSAPLQAPAMQKSSGNGVTDSKPKVEPESEVSLKKEKPVLAKQEPVREDKGGQVKKEIFIIKHRKSHDDRERNSKYPPAQQNVSPQPADNGVASTATNQAPAVANVGVRTSSCTKEEVDAILLQCGRLSRNSSGKAASGERGRKHSGSKRSHDFDQCDNSDLCEDDAEKRHQQRHRRSPGPSSERRRRTPSRERDQQPRSTSRERRLSRSPARRSLDTTGNPTNTASASATKNNNNNNNNTTTRPGKMVSVPASVSSLATDKSNNGGGGGGSSANAGIKRISVKRNVGGDSGVVGSRSAASPRSQSPARANGNAANQQQSSLSRNSSRKAEQSPHRRNPLSEIDPDSLAYPQSANNNSSTVQSRHKKEIETEAHQITNVDMNDYTKNRTSSRVALEKCVSVNCKTEEQEEEEAKGHSSMNENIVMKTLTRSRSSRRSRDLDFNPEALVNPAQSYTSLLLEDIQNFHQKNSTPSISLPACVTKACSILEAVADLNSTTNSNLSGSFSEDKRNPPSYQSIRNESNVSLGAANHDRKRVPDSTKDPLVESEVVVSDDVMEPSLHKYVTVSSGGSLGGVDMEDQESSGSNSFTISGQQYLGLSSSSWEPNSADSTDRWTSRLNSREEEGQKKLYGKRRECDQQQHSSGIGRGRFGANKGLHMVPVVTAAAST